ncbi:flagellar hook-associated family protein [Bradyrhizobium sp. WYCCWR 13023]|uniref:Flagellin n=1 Tax=Bradyrhizobium zhengyangense TaxID=2911009 RepID=A0A9X1RDW7_9BRAD|nr:MULTISPECIES: flagellar hook-associated family protein [Bradyrhizobium]MCG2629273.1 flagellar hook-associated family protein [Bradyrhizobium zhengyangense]MCG2640744.1 flagellar hook-associated family protein [Bradyrhizobium zhengyangense]MCG2670578.1 flagellar hook-associated family protein [Bradyrhizobium zhengyangense]MDA9518907.1 flagellar hook protein FlgL [Bradyrhizobium sp. CCBAU 11434]
MMSANYISTLVLHSSLRYSITNNQAALSKASTEATTGRFADVGLQLGATTGGDVTLRADLSFGDQLVDTNGLVGGRLDVTQDRITQLSTTATDFLKDLIAARSTDGGGRIILPPASSNLQDLIGALNISYNGSYLFSGINTQNQPITAYQAGSASKNKVDADFVAAFGFTQSSASVNTITPAQMQTFLNGPFDAEFASPAWNTNWSSATDQVMQSRISTTEIADTSVSANQTGFRKLAEAYTMMADLGNANLDQSTFQVVVDKAIGLVGSAITDLATLGGDVGTVQQRITNATDKLKTQKDILNNQIVGMEKVDPTEASVRVNTLQTQIQTALALTSQLQKISLINYL